MHLKKYHSCVGKFSANGLKWKRDGQFIYTLLMFLVTEDHFQQALSRMYTLAPSKTVILTTIK